MTPLVIPMGTGWQWGWGTVGAVRGCPCPRCPVPWAGLRALAALCRAVPSRAVIPSSCAGPGGLTGLRDPLPAKSPRCQPRVSRENAKQPASWPTHHPQPSSSSSAGETLPPSCRSPEPPAHPIGVPPLAPMRRHPSQDPRTPHRRSQGDPPSTLAPPPGLHVRLLWACLERDGPPSPNFPALCRAGTIGAFVFP